MPKAITQNEPAPSTAHGADRRASWRYGCGLAALVRLHVAATGERHFAWVHDVSLTGISFDLLSPLEHGHILDFELRPHDADRLQLQAHVVHTTALPGLHRIGCVLSKPLTHRRMGAILKQLRGEVNRRT